MVSELLVDGDNGRLSFEDWMLIDALYRSRTLGLSHELE